MRQDKDKDKLASKHTVDVCTCSWLPCVAGWLPCVARLLCLVCVTVVCLVCVTVVLQIGCQGHEYLTGRIT